MLKILFVTTTTRPTGAEKTLFNLIHNLDREKFKPIGIVCRFSGQLEPAYPPDISIYSFDKYLNQFTTLISLAKSKLLGKNYYENFLDEIHKRLKPDIWYINSIIQPEAIRYAQEHQIPCIVHCHEVEQMLERIESKDVERLITYPLGIIACSENSARMLSILGRENNLEVCFPCLNIEKITLDNSKSKKIRELLQIDNSTFVWAMSGSTDYNKNPVRFVEIAHHLNTLYPDTRFIWLGNNSLSGLDTYAKQYAKFLKISDKIIWTGVLTGDKYYNYLQIADAFVLTSSKESFSLVTIEALYMGKPVVSYDCGGTREIISKGMGHIVESGHISDIVEKMIQVMSNPKNYKFSCIDILSKYNLQQQSKKWNKILLDYFYKQKNV
ncbi:hypothetical protein C7H19_12335 [Aphanothece hegewaldii CCALA 016]|uniref:Glycosyl transferase family 1 domain-containing protein n=1 Tax=Aphanothece hegewaldii CCALA 016 TaxID=2107694 RepID=A0A2T1LX34_9CHRO|nr:glycosyltransferase [Aphanothece hegewaldii]PSF36751.1 hypothetical protein C7H19_12335 [Aphanothece hegewaldii CCALA 016]